MNLKTELINLAKKAKEASRVMAGVSSEIKNKTLLDMAESLSENMEIILLANKKDIQKAKTQKLSKALIDRLSLNEERIQSMCDSLIELTRLEDPVGKVSKAWRRPNGLWIHKISTPIGVIAIIYESRPNVTSDCIGLCFKSGNSVILRGGSEAFNSNSEIYRILKKTLSKNGLPEKAINMVTTSERKAVDILLKLNDYIDVVIPRGGEGLIRKVVESSTIPVIKHYKGICHVYVDAWANLKMAENIAFNAKVQRPGVCNAMECLLVDAKIAAKFLPKMIKKFKEAGVEIRGCPETVKLAKSAVKKASEKDYHTEYLDLILSVKVVETIDEAIRHINEYGSHHSDAIVSDNYENAMRFLTQVDSACVYVNASTRFTDGYQFGMGAEIGISTDKLHARGPMALEELTTYKYIIFGDGQIRQ